MIPSEAVGDAFLFGLVRRVGWQAVARGRNCRIAFLVVRELVILAQAAVRGFLERRVAARQRRARLGELRTQVGWASRHFVRRVSSPPFSLPCLVPDDEENSVAGVSQYGGVIHHRLRHHRAVLGW